MATKQALMLVEEKKDPVMTMKGWIVGNGTALQHEAKGRIVAIATIARVVVEVAPNKQKSNKKAMRKIFGTLTRDPIMSKKKLLREGNLLRGPKEGDMVIAKEKMIVTKGLHRTKEAGVVDTRIAEGDEEVMKNLNVAPIEMMAMLIMSTLGTK